MNKPSRYERLHGKRTSKTTRINRMKARILKRQEKEREV